MARVSTGCDGLDKMMGGGYIPGRPYLISGPPGSGKTILALQFLLKGIEQKEFVLMITVDEPPNEIKANVHAFGWDLGQLRILDATPDIKAHSTKKSIIDVGTTLDVKSMEDVDDIRKSSQLRTMEVSIHSVQKMLKQEFQDHLYQTGKRYTRIVVDSMTALRMFSIKQDANILVQSFLRFLSELEATILLTTDLPPTTEVLPRFFLTRGEVRLHKWFEAGKVRRAVSVEKFRGSGFDDHFRPMEITSQGLVVHPEQEVDLKGKEPDLTPYTYVRDMEAEEAFEVIEDALRMAQDARVKGVDVADVQLALTRAALLFELKRYNEMLTTAVRALDTLRSRLQGKAPVQPPLQVQFKR